MKDMSLRLSHASRRCFSMRVRWAKKPTSAQDSPEHYDLPSFLDYARRSSLAITSSVYTGTHYEYTALASLRRLGFSLKRTGGASDRGIDLLGRWSLPTVTTPLKVLIQCKATAEKAQPRLVRELEGAFLAVPPDFRQDPYAENQDLTDMIEEDVSAVPAESQFDPSQYGENEQIRDLMALLVTTREATKGVREALSRSKEPMGFMKMARDGNIEQLLWNKSAAQRGLEGMGVELRHRPRAFTPTNNDAIPEDAQSPLTSEIVLTFQGKTWERRSEESSDTTK